MTQQNQCSLGFDCRQMGFNKEECSNYKECQALSNSLKNDDLTITSLIIVDLLVLAVSGLIWFGLTSLSWAGATYSLERAFQPTSISRLEKTNFVPYLQQASQDIFWLTISIGLSIVLIVLIIGELIVVVAIFGFTIHYIRKNNDDTN